MAEQDLPPQTRRMAMYAAGGGFGGALLAIIVAKILSGPGCCCVYAAPGEDQRPAKVSTVTEDARPQTRPTTG